MQNAFLSLHLSILLAGTTGVFGKLINLSPMMIVWWRALIAGLVLYALVRAKNLFEKCSTKEIVKYVLLGIFLSYQWMLFYASIKASNISVGVVT
ncbi:MAG: EamA family transporter, partial [Sutterellaceae bacterium]|nr:EamA family transporter [Sutterellaceae bacterium]